MERIAKKSKYYPNIEILAEEYEIPQLNRKRRISVLLPHDYNYSGRYYPVLYLHDGQNLFDDYAPFGNWGVDKTLAHLSSMGLGDVIVVAIDHGGSLRIQEYLPFENHRFKESEGQLYLKFMMENLKPIIDSKYRVKSSRDSTGIGGSSMGGLISLYAGLSYPEIFGKLMIFSPSLWISSEIFTMARNYTCEWPTRMYLYAGGMESDTHYDNVRLLYNLMKLKRSANAELKLKMAHNPEGRHSEIFWGEQFPEALQWLYHFEEKEI
jgi:predicted alpha/beta superfamily hydrolase